MEPRHYLDGIFSKICKQHVLLNCTLLVSLGSVRMFCFRIKSSKSVIRILAKVF
ncbi:hypothetical protein Peur_043733 [Populus x canadensis]